MFQKSIISLLVVLFLTLSVSWMIAQELNSNSFESKTNQTSSTIELKLCFVRLIDDIDVPALQNGILESIDFREGDYVKLNQQVAKVDDKTAQLQLSDAKTRKAIAEKKATDNVEIEYAKVSYKYAYDQYDRELQLQKKGAGTQSEIDRWRNEAEKALKSIERAKADKQLAGLEKNRAEVLVKTAQDQIDRHIIRSKIDGNVFEIYKQAGEWVNAGDSVMRVIRMNRLRVQGFVDAGTFDRHQIANQKVTVTATLANGRKRQFQGAVSYVGLDEHAGNRFMIWADVDNQSENGQWLLTPNDEVTMKIHLGSAAIAAAPKTELKANPIHFKVPPAKEPGQENHK